jgi:polar amino acid transport system ATP-binding protein
MPLIAISDVKKSFGSHPVLRGISLDVDIGEVVAIVGRSGSGKSTLLRCLNGLEEIDEGSILVSGIHVSREEAQLKELRLKVGMIFQQFNLFPHLTAGQNVIMPQRVVRKTPLQQAQKRALEVLEMVGLQEKMDAYPSQLSGGQQQRVAIARALAIQPQALLCDEITSALDPELVSEVLSVIRKLAKAGMTIIMVTHEMSFAREVCDRVVFMYDGLVWESGSPQDIFESPRTPELRRFLGHGVQRLSAEAEHL